MTIATEITRIKTNIENAYSKAQEKGATVPQIKNSENLATCIESITGGGGGSSLPYAYAVSNGVLTATTGDIASFKGVNSIGQSALNYAFYQRSNLTGELSFPDLVTVDMYGFNYAFNGCKGITSVNLPLLETAGDGAFTNAFYQCNKITSINMPALKTIKTSTFNYAFNGCSSLTSISFPSLTSMYTNSFGNYAFGSCSKLTEIHFRADKQSAIESLTGYSKNFGATNATIYFDL